MKIDFRAGPDGNTTFLFVDGKQTITVWQTKDRTRACFVKDGKEIDLPAKNFALSSEEGRESLVAALLNAGALVSVSEEASAQEQGVLPLSKTLF